MDLDVLLKMRIKKQPLSFQLLEPWELLPHDGAALVLELKKELRPDSELYGLEAEAIAQRCDCDDVLFKIKGRLEQLAVVHLTWSGKTDPNKGWPSTELYADADSWKTNCMIPDHEDYTA